MLARAKGSAIGGLTWEVCGTWSRSADGDATEFHIQLPAAYGQILALVSDPGGEPTRRMIVGGIEATVLRSLETMFNGVDFAHATSDAGGIKILRTLTTDAEVAIDGA